MPDSFKSIGILSIRHMACPELYRSMSLSHYLHIECLIFLGVESQ